MKKTLAILLAVVMAITLFTACGDKPAPTPDSKTGSVYYLNFKPEADKAWQDLAKLYTEKTGVPVTVLTAASGTYDQVLTAEMVSTMAKDPMVFAMANPVPEIWPEDAKKGGAAVFGTGRSDYPNQINNVLAFPGIFRGALDVRASDINEEMKLAAAKAIAACVSDEELNAEYIMPMAFDKKVIRSVADAVAQAARDSGVARI